MTKYIASISFGKDSLAMLIKIKELGLPLDEVIYVDIRFDDETSGEMPLMASFIPKAEKILEEKFSVKVTHVTAVKNFKEQFYTKKKRGKHIGDYYGFPYGIGSWCNSYLKLDPLKKYFKQFEEDVIQYVGIAYGEDTRYERLGPDQIAPLYDLKITEEEAMEICRKYDLLSPIYETSFRGGCWFCGKQRISQLRYLHNNHKDLWNKLKGMEKDSFNAFIKGTTMDKLEERFEKEKEDK